MNRPAPRAVAPRDPRSWLALAAGLAMGHAVAAMAEQTVAPTLALPSAVAFVVFGSAAVVCALAGTSKVRWPSPEFLRWTAAIGAGLLVSLASPLLF